VRVVEAEEVTDRGHDSDAGDGVDSGDGHQPGDHRIGERFDCQLLVNNRQLAAVKVQLAQQSLHRGALVGRQRWP